MAPERKSTVLLSGGIDSAACLHFCLSARHDAEALFVDYGQVARDREEKAAATIADHFGVPLRRIHWRGDIIRKEQGVVLGRNAFLVLGAVMETGDCSCAIALGIHKGTDYWDCSQAFVELMQSLLDAYAGGRVQLLTPFLDWTKKEIWTYCQEQDLPTNLTYSCERGAQQPCGHCLSCQDLETLDVGE